MKQKQKDSQAPIAPPSEQFNEIKQKCEEYSQVYQNIRNLGFPVQKPDENTINQLKENNEKDKIIKYLEQHYCGSQTDFIPSLKNQLKQLGFELAIQDEIHLNKYTSVFSCEATTLGQKYNYEELFRIKQSPCPEKLLSYDHVATETANKLTDQQKQPEQIHLRKIQTHILTLLEKLERIVKFSKKLEGTIKDEKKLIKEFNDLEEKYQTEKNKGYDLDTDNDQKKKKTQSQTKKPTEENQGEAEKTEKKGTRQKSKTVDNEQADENQQQQVKQTQTQNNQKKEKTKKKQEKSKKKNEEEIKKQNLDDPTKQFESKVEKKEPNENQAEPEAKQTPKKQQEKQSRKANTSAEKQDANSKTPKQPKQEPPKSGLKQSSLSDFFKKKGDKGDPKI